jgi:glycosyltransferase involved in cell wall biosynthesis
MRVAVEFRNITPGAAGGVGYLVEGLFRELRRLEADIDLHFLVSPTTLSLVPKESRGSNIHSLPANDFWVAADSVLQRLSVDVLFRSFPSDDALTFPLSRQIVLIPDLLHEYYPQFFDQAELRERRRHFSRLIKASGAITTLSQYSRSTIEQRYSDFELDIFETPPSGQVTPADLQKTQSSDDSVEELTPYFFYPANSWPHKNHKTLVAAFARLRSRVEFENFRLVLTGDREHFTDRLERQPHVRHLGIVPRSKLARLYQHATALTFPSLFEGFGMPVVEAFGFGCPVVCSGAASLPEIAGDAALICDARDPAAIADAMGEVGRNPELRSRLISAGRERAKMYTWERSARALKEALLKVYARAQQPRALVREVAPRVSIVTPSFNQGRFVKRTIDSVLGQDYPNIEYVVVDGGSSDETVEILRSYGDRFTWISEADRGQAHAINKGIERASGRILSYLNSDDTLLPNAVSTATECFAKNPEIDLLYGDANYIDVEDTVIGRYPTTDYSFERLMADCCVCQPAAFWTAAAANVVGPFDECLHTALDYDYWLRIDRAGGIVRHIPQLLANSRIHLETKTMSQRTLVYREIFAVTRKHGGYVSRNYVEGYWHHRLWEQPDWIARVIRSRPGIIPHLINADAFRLSTKHASWISIFPLALKFMWRRIGPSLGKVNSGQLYADGWAGRWLKYELPIRARRIRISGTLPDIPPLRGQRLDILCNGVPVKKQELPFGAFAIEIECQQPDESSGTVLQIYAARSFVPANIGYTQDYRALSYIIHKIEPI